MKNQEIIVVLEKLIITFKPERMVHLGVTTISLLLLLIAGGFLVYKLPYDSSTIGYLGVIFGSSGGLLTYSANRLLRMWDQALQLTSYLLINRQDDDGKSTLTNTQYLEKSVVTFGTSSRNSAITSVLSFLVIGFAIIYGVIQLNSQSSITTVLTSMLSQVGTANSNVARETMVRTLNEVGTNNPDLAREVIDKVVKPNDTIAKIIPLIYIQVGNDQQKELARRLITLLRNQGYTVPDIENVGMAKLPPTPEVRYFRPQQKTGAQQVIKILTEGSTGVSWQPTYVRGFENTTSPMQYEIWFGRE